MIRYALAAIAVTLLTACVGSSTGAPGIPLQVSQDHSSLRASSREVPPGTVTESVVYSFGTKSPDGLRPDTDLTEFRGVLYGGTTSNNLSHYKNRDATIYSVTTLGNESVLRFLKDTEAQQLGQGLALGPKPPGGGTAFYVPGAFTKNGLGTVFEIGRLGKTTVLHEFSGGSDGAEPIGTLTLVNGTFYGTTALGGGETEYCQAGCGTVYSITPAGDETPIYRFNGSPDGAFPEAGLLNVNGTLFGTTEAGGAYDNGTLFSVTTSGVETVLHSFAPYENQPSSPIAVNGTLYGTTEYGGQFDAGTVYSATPSGSVQILHSFGGRRDGYYPLGLVNVNGVLYGATESGGTSNDGTVFRVTTSGHERVLHNFTGGADGQFPAGNLADVKHTLYGTTLYGGSQGQGTVYKISFAK
ncbi:MAG: choice-of-anchor tandem repeat GloVer-containing protein [Candidatus Cybelea sp.]